MKTIVLFSGKKEDYENIILDVCGNDDCLRVNTENRDEKHELSHLKNCLKEFENSNKEMMMVKFSGREFVAREIGDITTQMVVTISYNKKSHFYVEKELVSTLVRGFKIGTFN